MQRALDAVCDFTGWPIGHAFSREPISGVLLSMDVWHRASPDRDERFVAVSRTLILRAGKELPGRVLESGRPEWVDDFGTHETSRRAEAAEAAGVRGAFALPIVSSRGVEGVLEFFAPAGTVPDAVQLDQLAAVGSHLGEVIDRSRALSQPDASQNQFGKLLELAPDPLIVIDEQGLIVLANEQAEVLTGYASTDLVGRPADSLVPESARSADQGTFLHPTADHNGERFDLQLRTCTGAEVPVEVSLSPVEASSGRVVVASMRDVSERRQAETALHESRQRLAEAQRIAHIGSWSWSVATDSVSWSDELYRLYGLDPATGPASFADYLQRVHPGDRDRVAAAITSTVQSLAPYEHDYRIVLPSGAVRRMHARGEVTARDGDRALQLMGYCHDVTEHWEVDEKRRQAQDELASQQLVLQRIARGQPLAATLDLICAEIERTYPGSMCSVLVVDADDRSLRLAAGPSLPGALRRGVDGLPIREGASACGTAAARNETVVVEDTLLDPLTADFTDLAMEEQLRSVWARPLTNATGEVVGTFAVYRRVRHRPDESERRAVAAAVSMAALALERSQNLERLSAAARFDSLTGLSNRAWFLSELGHQLTDSRLLAVMFLDLDGFKWINDSLGHPTGDRILLDVARRLKTALGDRSTLARFGGDEFALMVVDAEVGVVEEVAARIESAMSAPFVLDRGEFFLSVSIGIAYSSKQVRPDELIRDADTAMYAAKERAGSSHATFNSRLRDRAVHRITLESELRRAIERDEFVMHYQPMVDLRTRTWAGVESLVRWQHPTRGLLAPDLFIPFAEESGLIVPLGAGLLRQVVEFGARLGDRLPGRGVTLNVSARQLSDPVFGDEVLAVLHRYGLRADQLGIEITETALMREFTEVHLALDPLADQGISLVIDDFGCGYSSIARLRELPVTGMKIDKSFCSDLGTDQGRDNVVASIVDLAHALDLYVVMEGIESALAAQTSADLGADLGQGFHFARPMPADDLLAVLSRPPQF